MGGSLAVFNTTSFRVEITLRGTKKASFKRTCDPSTVCAFDNIQIANYAIEIKLDEKIIIRQKCWAKGSLFTLIETRDSNMFKLEGNKDTFIFHLKRGAPLGFELEGRQIVRVKKGFKRPLKVGWTLDQVGPVILRNLNPDEPGDLKQEDIVKFRRDIEEKIFKLVYSTFSGTVVLVFDTTTKLKRRSVLSPRSSVDGEKDGEIMVEKRVELTGTPKKIDEVDSPKKRKRRLSWPLGTVSPLGTSTPNSTLNDSKSEQKTQSSPPSRVFRSLAGESPSLKNIFNWPSRSKSSLVDEPPLDANKVKSGSLRGSPSLFSKVRSRMKEQIIEVQSKIYASPKIKFTFPVLKEWFVLIETHRLLLMKEREAIRNLVLSLQNAFEQEQVLMEQRMISVVEEDLSSSQEESVNGKLKKPESVGIEEERKKGGELPAGSVDNVESASLVAVENIERNPESDRERNSSSTPKAILEEHAEVHITRYDDIDENAVDVDDTGESAEEHESPPTETKDKVPEALKLKRVTSKKVPDTRKFEYPFVEAVKRLSTVGLELHDLDPVKFLEHEVHYVQASLEAQVAITGEPYELSSEQNCAPGWSVCYMDSTSKVYWVRDLDGATSLDPPTEEFWVLLANPFEPLNPFPYPAVD